MATTSSSTLGTATTTTNSTTRRIGTIWGWLLALAVIIALWIGLSARNESPTEMNPGPSSIERGTINRPDGPPPPAGP